jgi:hypothetical protein
LLEQPGILRLAGREVPADRVLALEKPLRERLVDDRTDMLDSTGNIKLVSETLGHASVETTARYLHPSKKGLAEHVNQRNTARKGEAAAAVVESGHTFGHTITFVQ